MALEAVTRSATEQPIFTTLGIATATEHSGILLCDNISQGRGSPLGSDGLLGSCNHRFPGHRVFSIGSVKIRHDVSNEPATRVIAKVQHEIHCRLHLYISSDEIIEMCDYCSDPATEQEGIRGSSSKSWSGTIEAISRCVAAYQKATNADEISNGEDIMNKLKSYVQALLQKCVPNVYLRQHVASVITDYIWNRSCNVALHMLLDDIVTSGKCSRTPSQQDLNYTVDLLGHCAGYLKTSYHEILTELLHYRRSDVLLF